MQASLCSPTSFLYDASLLCGHQICTKTATTHFRGRGGSARCGKIELLGGGCKALPQLRQLELLLSHFLCVELAFTGENAVAFFSAVQLPCHASDCERCTGRQQPFSSIIFLLACSSLSGSPAVRESLRNSVLCFD